MISQTNAETLELAKDRLRILIEKRNGIYHEAYFSKNTAWHLLNSATLRVEFASVG
jgi:hypothetical protein